MTDETDATPRPDPSEPILLGGPDAPAEKKVEAERKAAASPPPSARPASAPSASASATARPILPMLVLAGFVVLAGCIAYLWTRPTPPPLMPAMPPDQSGVVAALRSQVSSLQSALSALDAREKSDVANLHEAIAAIPTAAAPPATPSAATPPAPTASPAPDMSGAIAQLKDQIAQLQAAQSAQAQTAQSLPSASTIASLAARVDAIAQREAKDGDSIRQDLTAVQQQVAAVTGQAKTLAKDTSTLPQLSATSGRLSQILRAQEALRAGQPLGTIDHAPPALARFATSAPPTEAALRLAFPDAARAAAKAGQPLTEKGGFWHRTWQRVQDLITIRQGDRVVVGDPTSGTLAHAQRLLDAGDLAGAVGVIDSLNGPAAVAMAPWQAQAKALLAARQALAQMAAG